MDQNEHVIYTRQLCERATSEYSGIESTINGLKQKLARCKSQIQSKTSSIQQKQMGISGRQTQIAQFNRNIELYQQQYSDLLSRSAYAEDENELRSIQAQVREVRAKAEQEQKNIESMEKEIAALQSEIDTLKSDIDDLKIQVKEYSSDLSKQAAKCKKIASTLNTSGHITAVIASRMNNQVTGFDKGSHTKYGSDSGRKAAWRSSDAEKVNRLGTEAINLSQKYNTLAARAQESNDDDPTPGTGKRVVQNDMEK